MVAGVETDDGALAELHAVHVRRAPVGDVRGVEGGLEQLVLQDETLAVAEPGVDLPERVGETVLAVTEVGLARVVEPVGEPHLEVAAPGDVHDVDAVEGVADRLLPHSVVDVTEAAEHVVVVLEGVGVDGSEADAQVLGVAPELVEVVDEVPGDVQRDRRSDPGDSVHLRSVGDLLVGVAWHPSLGEDLEPRAGVAERPGRQLDGLTSEVVGYRLEGWHPVLPSGP